MHGEMYTDVASRAASLIKAGVSERPIHEALIQASGEAISCVRGKMYFSCNDRSVDTQ
jgi:hypothetical protein